MLLVSTTRIIPGRAVPSFLSGRYPAVKVRKKLYVTDTVTFDEWIDLDLLYIKKCSVWSDFKLIIQTVGVVLTMQGS